MEQFLNKLRYAKEGARDMMDRACADLPWQVWLEVDEKDIEIPKVKPSPLSNSHSRVSDIISYIISLCAQEISYYIDFCPFRMLRV